MSRKLRIWHRGEIYHITARGNRKGKIYEEPGDYRKYLQILKETQAQHAYTLHGYCLMPNHVHLLIEMVEASPSQIMKTAHTRYAMYYNFRYDLVGHLFQGRFKSQVVYSKDYLLTVSRYIHQNPVKAGLVDHPEGYPWSSYNHFIDIPQLPPTTPKLTPLVSTNKILSFFPDSHEYQMFVESNDYENDIENGPLLVT
ncbi:REP-associated tyrosine transposase [Salinibacillus xinjiangensis]|uniref:REP-associated tyrosine transposase n=1 Tax=Salinibacillus xinjiangensis TaxID=1229268 RepID=UPI001891E891|nr:transposase [Salinibacillus xinjiangensis]